MKDAFRFAYPSRAILHTLSFAKHLIFRVFELSFLFLARALLASQTLALTSLATSLHSFIVPPASWQS